MCMCVCACVETSEFDFCKFLCMILNFMCFSFCLSLNR